VRGHPASLRFGPDFPALSRFSPRAIYARKSTEEGLEQEFNSLDAQREAGEAFVASQRHDGWHTLPDRYDDGIHRREHRRVLLER